MNNLDTNTSRDGILLTDNVDIDFLKEVSPRYHNDFIKFIVDTKNNKVVVGMDIHADGLSLIKNYDINHVYGGNIYFENKNIVYESTLNIDKNIEQSKIDFDDPRVILDSDMIDKITPTLFSWIIL